MARKPHRLALKRKDYFGDPRQRLYIHREASQSPIEEHSHEFFEIAIVFSGTGIHTTGGFRQTLQTGDVLVINSRRTHGYLETKNLNLVNLLIRDDLLLQLTRGLEDISGHRALFNPESSRWRGRRYASYLRASARELRQLEEWILHVEEELSYGKQSSFILAEAYLSLIIGTLSRRYGRQAEVLPKPRVFEDLSAWLEGELARPVTVAEMAMRARMSERTFYRAFRESAGISPLAHLLNLRLRRAADLLREGGAAHSVTEIAQLCGFDDSNYFSRCFRRFSGLSPKEFRQKK